MLCVLFAVGSQNSNLKVLYSHSKQQPSASKSIRHVPQSPERVLDAPDILDDYCGYTRYDAVIFLRTTARSTKHIPY